MTKTSMLPAPAEAALQELLSLTPEQRLEASERLLADIDFTPTTEEIQEWERRISAYESNPARAIDFDESMRRLTEKLHAQRASRPAG